MPTMMDFNPSSFFETNFIGKNVGYTDGSPFLSACCSVPSYNKNEKICGFTYGYMANRGDYRSPLGVNSQKRLYSLGINWVCLAVANYQQNYYSTHIHSDYMRTPTDWDIAVAVERAHNNNIHVCLKPMVNTEDGVWRARIGFPDLHIGNMDYYWDLWFTSYRNFILHYAELAQELNCEMFCIGCEMIGTEHREKDWLNLINEIRRVYSGKIVYNANHDREDAERWFDELDYIGTSAYYPVGVNGINYEAMAGEWQKIKWRLDAIAESRKKQYIFMETGCRSATNSSTEPWDFSDKFNEFNEHEQTLYYSTLMNVFKDSPNFAGIFWWDWPTILPAHDKTNDLTYSIYNKEAERVLRTIYKKIRSEYNG